MEANIVLRNTHLTTLVTFNYIKVVRTYECISNYNYLNTEY